MDDFVEDGSGYLAQLISNCYIEFRRYHYGVVAPHEQFCCSYISLVERVFININQASEFHHQFVEI